MPIKPVNLEPGRMVGLNRMEICEIIIDIRDLFSQLKKQTEHLVRLLHKCHLLDINHDILRHSACEIGQYSVLVMFLTYSV